MSCQPYNVRQYQFFPVFLLVCLLAINSYRYSYKYCKRQCAKMIISRACLPSALHTHLSHKFLAAVLSRNLQDVMDLSRSLCAYTQLLPPTLSKSDQSGLSAPSAHPHSINSSIHRQGGQRQVSVFMNIVLRLKSWYVAAKPVFPPKYSRRGIHTSRPKKWRQT